MSIALCVSIDAHSLKWQIERNQWIFYDDVTLMGYFAMKNVRAAIFIMVKDRPSTDFNRKTRGRNEYKAFA